MWIVFNVCDYVNDNKTEHNPNWPYIPANALLNLINNRPDIDKIYLYAKDLYEDKYQLLINKRESTG